MPFHGIFRFRYTLRALLVFITLFALWGGYHTNRGWKERRAREVLTTQSQSSFGFEHHRNLRDPMQGLMAGYEWLVGTLWGDRHVTEASIGSNLEPQVVEALGSLPDLTMLGLGRRGLSRAEWESGGSKPIQLERVSIPGGALRRAVNEHSIKEISIGGYILTDEDCESISDHHTIEHLTLVDVDISSRGLVAFLGIPRLRSLSLSKCAVTGDDFEGLTDLRTIEQIAIAHSRLSSKFALVAARCLNLRHLSLIGSSIDDRFVTGLSGHSSISELLLSATHITDESIPVLAQLPSLKSVSLPYDRLTADDVAKLRQANPKLVITY